MKSKYVLIGSVFFLSVTATVFAQAPEQIDAIDERLVRYKYSFTSELPNGQAFSHLAGTLQSLDRETAIQWLQYNGGFEEGDAIQILDLIISSKESMSSEIAVRQEKAGCVSGAAKVFGNDTYAVLTQLDDIADQASEETIQTILSQLTDKKSEKLQLWLDSEKENIVFLRFDHEQVHRLKGISGDEVLGTICNGLYVRSAAEAAARGE